MSTLQALPANLESLPPEVVTSILVDLPFQQVLQSCRTSRYLRSFCQSYSFWAAKAQHDFQLPPPVFLANQTLDPRARYRLIERIMNYLRVSPQSVEPRQTLSKEVGKLGDVRLVDYFAHLNPTTFNREYLLDAVMSTRDLIGTRIPSDQLRRLLDDRRDLIAYLNTHPDIFVPPELERERAAQATRVTRLREVKQSIQGKMPIWGRFYGNTDFARQMERSGGRGYSNFQARSVIDPLSRQRSPESSLVPTEQEFFSQPNSQQALTRQFARCEQNHQPTSPRQTPYQPIQQPPPRSFQR
jgi:hypothetical protein